MSNLLESTEADSPKPTRFSQIELLGQIMNPNTPRDQFSARENAAAAHIEHMADEIDRLKNIIDCLLQLTKETR